MKITEEQIKDIAQDLDTGMNVYLNRDTLETVAIPELDDFSDQAEFWEEELERIENEWLDHIVLEKMDSNESFRIMENFVATVDDQNLKSLLSNSLAGKKPFANFKTHIDNSSYRQIWFDFKQAAIEKYVKRLLEAEHFEFT